MIFLSCSLMPYNTYTRSSIPTSVAAISLDGVVVGEPFGLPGPRACRMADHSDELGCLVAFGVWLKKPLFGAVLAGNSTGALCPPVNQAIFGELLGAKNIPIANLSINVERELVRAKQREVLWRKGRLLWRDKHAFPSRRERLCPFPEVVWSSRKHLFQRIFSEPSMYPSPQAVSGGLAAILEMNLCFRDARLGEYANGRIHADISSQLFLGRVVHLIDGRRGRAGGCRCGVCGLLRCFQEAPGDGNVHHCGHRDDARKHHRKRVRHVAAYPPSMIFRSSSVIP